MSQNLSSAAVMFSALRVKEIKYLKFRNVSHVFILIIIYFEDC